MSYLVSIGTAVPRYKSRQMDIHGFMDSVYSGSDDERKRLKILYERSGIRTRHSAVPDYDPGLSRRELFPGTTNLEPFPSLEQRMLRFHEEAPGLAETAIIDCLSNTSVSLLQLTHLITVSCTGLAAPGLDLMLVEKLGLSPSIHRTSVNFMGCYAAVHAMKMADAICRAEPNAKVMIASAELCTLHFQKKQDYDNLTANAIFADGAAAALITSRPEPSKSGTVAINGFYSEVHASGKNDMAWQLSSTGFLMTLSSYIPQLIEKGIEPLLRNALGAFNVPRGEVTQWAIHPGGRKILDVTVKELALQPNDLRHSYAVLEEYGNMSSATILFVLQRMLSERAPGPVFGAAFGPGLTMETFVLRQQQGDHPFLK